MIDVHSLVIRRGNRVVVDEVDLSAGDGSTIGVVGPNGAGKSTLVQAMYRALPAASGEVLIDSSDVTSLSRRAIARAVAVVSQERDEGLPLTVRDAVGLGRLSHRSLAGYGDAEDRSMVDAALARVDITYLADRLITQLSGGERQRALIARAIAQDADHLLLDEPTNHLDADSIVWLRSFLQSYSGGVLMISHDTDLVEATVNKVFHLDANRSTIDIYSMGWKLYLRQRAADEKRRHKERINAERKASALQAQAEKMGAKATKAVAAKNMARRAERMLDAVEGERAADKVAAIRFPEPAPCGKTPLMARNLTKTYGCLLYTSPSPRDQRGSRMPSSA